MWWPFGKKAKKRRRTTQSRAYQMAVQGRLTADWNVQSTSADADTIPNLRVLRARSRDLCQNNDYARRFLSLLKMNVIGSKGILLQNKARDDDGQLDKRANDKVEAGWRDWGRRGTCTMDGAFSWIGLKQAVIEAVARDGEALLQVVKAGKYGYALHFLEADLLDDEYNDEPRRIRGGVQCDVWGRPVGYWMLKEHPGDVVGTHRKHHTFVPAEHIIHLFVKERAGQTRGVPWLVTPAYRMKQLGGVEEAELVASRVAASKMGFYTSDDGDGYQGDDEEESGALITEAEPGMFEQLPAGMSFEAWDPSHPNTAFPDFCKSLLRGIASGLNVSYVSLANDLEGVSYSSIRQGELTERDGWKLLQHWFIDNFCDQVFGDWLPMALLSGLLDLPFRKLDKFSQPLWIARGWNWVDPEKEIKANLLAVRNGLKSLSDVVGEQGYSLEDVFERIAAEKKLAESLGLDLPVLFGEIEDKKENDDGKTGTQDD